ncbi:MaoC/PaaZ C-terminal domain-containing protein [Cognatishimia activa]|uniref:MaoC/PaaZ C-terminal domain-containing protein n=1 Tax=Cognatishimia activa TaxID=1715691 RepID=UPI002231D39D|nr:MaoC/PaaZ C-terminal domain-containing protein [Cognatishimia activa]UZD90334.1 hypothetical protein M0D42_12155 [Cognatishimia activa]
MIGALTIGSQLVPEQVGAVSTDALVPYLEQVGDDNPLHRDPAVAVNAGLVGIPIPGQLLLSVMERYAKARTEGYALQRITVQFVSPVFTEKPFDLTGRVVAQHEAERVLVLRLQMHQNGERSVVGEARVSLHGTKENWWSLGGTPENP